MATQKKKTNIKTETKANFLNKIKDLLKSKYLSGERINFILGLLILSFSLFLLLSFISYLVNGNIDYPNITQHNDNSHYANYCGRWGAQLSFYFFNNLFGISAFFIPIFLIALSMRMLHTYRIHLWRWFLHCGFLMVWLSIALTMLSDPQFIGGIPSSWLKHLAGTTSVGGAHGYYICHELNHSIGIVGLSLIVLFSAIIYLAIIWSKTITVVKAILRPADHIAIPEKIKDMMHHKTDNNATDTEEEEQNNEQSVTDDTITTLTTSSSDAPITKEEEIEATEEYTKNDNTEVTQKEEDEVQEEVEQPTDNSLTATPSSDDDKQEEETPQPQEEEENNNTEKFTIKTLKEEERAHKTSLEHHKEELGPYDPRKDLEHYKFPTLSLLKHYSNLGPDINMEEQQANKERIVKVLKDFGVDIVDIEATIGPTITLYEVTPAPGVRINKIRNLGDDIALSLSAIGIRIIAPIPGRGTIGIEVPNRNPKLVSMESILNSKKFEECEYELPLAIGKTITNEVFMVDLAKMPHILVAGATGQGKSVGLNAMITSLLYKKHPSEMKLVMVDPKKVEFSVYTPLEKYFLAKLPSEEEPIITDVNKVVQTLKSLCAIMDHRYDLLKKAKVRHIKEYNAKFIQRRLNPNDGHEFMPYIVIIIDEFGDLIMTAGKEVELPIARIAQLARAVGMHLIIATQRPTTNIITGTIKANFPARMAFKVTSSIDSRTILERPGANQLIGRGDLLFLSGTEPVRVQCAFLNTQEVDNINKFISAQQGYISAYELPEVEDDTEEGTAAGDGGPLDDLFSEVARYIILNQAGSTSLIQRKFAIGYNRAGRLMDQLENHGIVGPARGSKPREVLIQDESYVDQILNK